MARILTGIQSTGRPHLGNLLGAIIPGVELSKDSSNHSLFFIADLHSLTTIKWIAFGLDIEKNLLYRQSHVTQVCELTWYLNCFTPFPMLANAHSFKDKSDRLSDVNSGLFTYPVLMAADIILYDANYVPVGKDQVQHLEMTRDIASSFNHIYGETFVIPEVRVDKKVMVVPGTDGEKMSKSYGNIIDIFLEDKALRKVILSIVTDSTPLEEPKNPDTCNVFSLYRLLATDKEITEMRQKYEGGNYGYGHAKQELFELIVNNYSEERKIFHQLVENPDEITRILEDGEQRAALIANNVIQRVRNKLGY